MSANKSIIPKFILITGCSSGIGLHCAQRLQADGYQVIASARNLEDVERLTQLGLQTIQLDLDDSQSIQTAVEETLQICDGRLYGIFHNGAYGQPGAVEDLSREVLRAQLETNVLGWHELTCLLLPALRQQGYGRIVYNSSVLGFVAMAYRGAYNCSKFALEGLVDTLRLELHDTDIKLSLIEPGPISSNFRKNALVKFQQHIDTENSPHAANYQAMLARLEKEGPAAPFTLPPEAVYKSLKHALESRRPRIRYRVTFPTKLFALLKRLFSSRLNDKLLIKASGGGSR